MSATGRGTARRAFDAYPTPAWCVDRLLERVPLPGGRWLEPCAGDGAVIRAVLSRRSDVIWFANELREECAPPLRTLVGGRITIGSYLDRRGATAPFDAIVTNPPYAIAEQFVERALTHARHVAMLLRLNYVGSARRAPFFRTTPPDVYVLPNRPSFVGKGSDACEYAWFVWGPERRRARGSLAVLATTSLAERAPTVRVAPAVMRGSRPALQLSA